MAYRSPVTGKQKKLSFGAYPVKSLAAARNARDEAREDIANGIDPSTKKQEKKLDKAIAKTFGEWADEWLAAQLLESMRNGGVEKTRQTKRRNVGYLKKQFSSLMIPAITVERVPAISGNCKLRASWKRGTGCARSERKSANMLTSSAPATTPSAIWMTT
jgi:Arm DNA-binding domain